MVHSSWGQPDQHDNSAKNLAAKFKRLHHALKAWSKNLSNLNLLISNCNTLILFFDDLEERRALHNTERNLRSLIKDQIAKLLHSKQIYWRQRYTINRVKHGDECTKFFHAMATISFRRNPILPLTNSDGAVIQDHAWKAGLIWNSFKGRMGITTNPVMVFNLEELIPPLDDLDQLVSPF